MTASQKQYSSYNLLPKNNDNITTVLPRKLLKNDFFINNFDSRNEMPLLCYLTNLILNKKNDKHILGDCVILKYSTLRNFIRKKCHSDSTSNLNEIVDSFLEKVSKVENLSILNVFQMPCGKIELSFTAKYLKMLEKNTVSFNILDLTRSRGLKAKNLFLKIISFDMRDVGKRYFTLNTIAKYLNLDSYKKRKSTIRMIKRAFASLKKRSILSDSFYIGWNKKDPTSNYRFIYILGKIKQIIV